MRPIKLTMTGFESYLEKTEIDFDKLGTKGLYLISGDTGSGKTTIFDAITFALYGKPSGTNREAEMLRSDFADTDTPTEVEFTFESRGKQYRIKRNPEYQRKSKRGTGTTTEKANALLEFLTTGDTPVEGTTNVDEKVVKILKLKKDNFCKIAMIAQGAFQEMLTAKTEDKKKLFRELFATEKYKTLTENLKTENSAAERELSEKKKALSNALNELYAFSEENSRIAEMKATGLVRQEDIAALEKYEKKTDDKLKILDSDFKSISEKIKKNEINLRQAEHKEELKKNLQVTKEEIAKKENSLKLLSEKLKVCEENLSKKTSLSEDATRLKDSLDDYQKINDEEKKLSHLRKEIITLQEEIQNKKRQLEEKQSQLEKNKGLLKELDNAGLNQLELEQECKRLYEINKDANEILKLFDDLSFVEKEHKKLTENLIEREKDTEEKQNEYDRKRRLYNAEIAGILAESLEEGKPCPVCGSLHHPEKALKSPAAPSKEQLEALEKNVNHLKEDCSFLAKEAGIKMERKTALEEQIRTNASKILSELPEEIHAVSKKLEETISQTSRELESKNAELKEAKIKVQRKTDLEKEIPSLEEAVKALSEKIQGLEKETIEKESEKKNSENNLSEKKAGLKFEDMQKAASALKELNLKIQKIDADFKQAQEECNNCDRDIHAAKGKAEQITAEINTLPEYDLAKLSEEKNSLKNSQDKILSEKDNLLEARGRNSSAIKNIKEITPLIPVLEKKYEMINSLYQITAGTSNTDGKLSLETFVQIKYLDEITRYANARLKVMTDRQYELVRKTEKADNRSQYGLDFNVKDFYTGKERSVQSLSGGEKFQASLSLALGLADEIQNSNGGIKLDTMFIDEGFGTLDQDTLNKCMKSLEELSKDNKQIGIISHVEELKERIPHKILVTKDKLSGKSSLEIVNDL